MSRYKGRTSTKETERHYPHVVEIPVPPGGFGKTLDEMHEWHLSLKIESRRGTARYEEPSHYVRWCFADRDKAEEFQKRFGGKMIIPPMPDDPDEALKWIQLFIQG